MSQPKFVAEADAVFTYPLTLPINAYGVELATIGFRRPRGGDLTRCGNPVKWFPGATLNEVAFDEKKLALMLAALSNVPVSSIENMDPQDLIECGWGIARFFIPGVSTTRDAPPSTSRNTSGATPSPSSIETSTS